MFTYVVLLIMCVQNSVGALSGHRRLQLIQPEGLSGFIQQQCSAFCSLVARCRWHCFFCWKLLLQQCCPNRQMWLRGKCGQPLLLSSASPIFFFLQLLSSEYSFPAAHAIAEYTAVWEGYCRVRVSHSVCLILIFSNWSYSFWV